LLDRARRLGGVGGGRPAAEELGELKGREMGIANLNELFSATPTAT
jgi:hypothetical protein